MKNKSDDNQTPKPRPSKRNEGLIRQLLTIVAAGNPVKSAARMVGINPATLWRWRQADPELEEAVQAARAAFHQRQVERIDQAAGTDWKAAAWLLARSEPAVWGGKTETQIEIQPVSVVHPLTGRVVGGPYDGIHEDDLPALPEGE